MEKSDISFDDKKICKLISETYESANNFEYFQSFDE